MKGKHFKDNSKKVNSSKRYSSSKSNTNFNNRSNSKSNTNSNGRSSSKSNANPNSRSGSKRSEKKKKSLYPVFLLISIIIMGICAVYIYRWTQDSKHNEDLMDLVKETVIEDNKNEDKENNKTPEETINFDKLKEFNSDVVGWIKVNNTNIDYPVVKCGDNSFYLNHSFDKTYNGQGWPFVDYEVRLDGTDKNITIYGHNIKDGSMFGSLKKILNEDWYKNSANFNLSYITEEENATYRVFSVYETEKELYYTNNNFENGAEYQEFLDELKSRSIVDFKVNVNKDDQILTLSTCADNNQYRVVLHAKRVKKN